MKASERRDYLLSLTSEQRQEVLARMSDAQRRALRWHWRLWAHEGQLPPQGDWQNWLIMAGRGFGKTRAGAEWVRSVAEVDPSARIALVGASLAEARAVMVEGDSGLLAVGPTARRPRFEASKRLLTWPNGAQATLFSAAEPETLRGPQHSHAWCDEIAKWDMSGERAMTAWDNLLLGMRLGNRPRVLATTTPRPVPLMQRLLAGEAGGETAATRGTTYDNAANLPAQFIRAIRREFGGTALGRQELDGEMLVDIDGALWNRSLIEQRRDAAGQECTRVVIGVDPPASTKGDACGIVVAGLREDGVALVLADCTRERASPENWARAVAQAADAWDADRIVAEANQGGAMVESVLRAAERSLPISLVHARKGKSARAEPVAALYEAGRVRHCGLFAKLEDQLCGMMAGGEYHGPGRSPDRADALVWALTELMLKRQGSPRILAI